MEANELTFGVEFEVTMPAANYPSRGAFSGTINAVKAIGYVRVCLGIVERAVNGKKARCWGGRKSKGAETRNGTQG